MSIAGGWLGVFGPEDLLEGFDRVTRGNSQISTDPRAVPNFLRIGLRRSEFESKERSVAFRKDG